MEGCNINRRVWNDDDDDGNYSNYAPRRRVGMMGYIGRRCLRPHSNKAVNGVEC